MNRLQEFLEGQRAEALGPVNRWYCSEFYGFDVTDPDQLLRYYILHGGASHFRQTHSTREEIHAGSGAEV